MHFFQKIEAYTRDSGEGSTNPVQSMYVCIDGVTHFYRYLLSEDSITPMDYVRYPTPYRPWESNGPWMSCSFAMVRVIVRAFAQVEYGLNIITENRQHITLQNPLRHETSSTDTEKKPGERKKNQG